MCVPLGLGSEAEEGMYMYIPSTYKYKHSTSITEDILSTAIPRAMPRVQVHAKYMLVQLQYISELELCRICLNILQLIIDAPT